MNIAQNIRILREDKGFSQEQLADELGITRARLGAYEENRNQPPIEMLILLSDYFKVSVDALIRADLKKTHPNALLKIGRNRTLLPIQVDKESNDLVEVISMKASAGYLNGYADPEFIEELPVMNLPFKIVGKHRAFPIKGDSMPPLKNGTIVVGRYIESFDEVKDGLTYIVLTKDDGLVYKRLYREKKKANNIFEFHSDNPAYAPYTVKTDSILEIWSFVCSLNIGEFKHQELNIDNVIRFLQSYRVEMGK